MKFINIEILQKDKVENTQFIMPANKSMLYLYIYTFLITKNKNRIVAGDAIGEWY